MAPSGCKALAKQTIWICCLGDAIIGYAAGCTQPEAHLAVFPGKASYFELEDFYLLPAQRGQGQGSAFFQYVQAQLCQQGIARLVLSTATKDMPRILRFYHAQGMETWTTILYKELGAN
jgi:GNAT superfamily N-acetyltransferase